MRNPFKSQPEPTRGSEGAGIAGPRNPARERQEPFTLRPPDTDHGPMPNLKWSFADSHMRLEKGGWTREATSRELPIAKELAGVNMRLLSLRPTRSAAKLRSLRECQLSDSWCLSRSSAILHLPWAGPTVSAIVA
jgi:hypothetical protein